MTIPVSTAPAASSYLLSAIQSQVNADPLVDEMLVVFGAVGQYRPNNIIAITEVSLATAPETFIGTGDQFWLNEKYNVNVEVNTWQQYGDVDGQSTVATALNDRAWQLVGYVNTAVRADPSLGGLVDIAYPAGATSTGPMWTEDPIGLGVGITVPIRVECLN